MANNSLTKAFDDLDWIIKLILCIPCIAFLWGIYRIVKGAEKNNVMLIVIGILWIVPFGFITWLIDLICVIIYQKPTVFVD